MNAPEPAPPTTAEHRAPIRRFWSTCPACEGAFTVAWELRHAGERLICPYCGNRYLPDESLALDERWPEEEER